MVGGDQQDFIDILLGEPKRFLADPAHGDPIDAPTTLFRRYVAHRLLREAKVLAAVARQGPDGARDDELLPDAYDDVPPTIWPIALLSLRAHLAKLEAEGHVRIDHRSTERSRYIAGR